MPAKNEQLPPEQREQIKGNKLEYFYQIPDAYAHLPLLGSAIRALGKAWTVDVDFSGDKLNLFLGLQDLLNDPLTLRVNQVTDDSDLLIVGGRELHFVNNKGESFDTLGKRHVMVAGSHADDNYDLVSNFSIAQINNWGVTALTGTGKGKTTTALGLAAEQFVAGRKTAVVQWFKERKSGRLTWAINEHFFPQMLKVPGLITFEPNGLGFFGSPTMDRVSEYQAHRDKAYQGLELARRLIQSGDYGLVVLDEFVDTVPEISGNIEVPLIDIEDVRALLDESSKQNQTQVVVTGRKITETWGEFVGSSIVINEVKHPWSTKQAGAVSGLDF